MGVDPNAFDPLRRAAELMAVANGELGDIGALPLPESGASIGDELAAFAQSARHVLGQLEIGLVTLTRLIEPTGALRVEPAGDLYSRVRRFST
jgi:hypothetical protein